MADRDKSAPKAANAMADEMPDEMMDASLQAAQFERVRTAQQTEKAEDYVEMIDDLINAYGEARVVELAKRFGEGTSPAFVNGVLDAIRRRVRGGATVGAGEKGGAEG